MSQSHVHVNRSLYSPSKYLQFQKSMSLCAFENIPPINKRLHVIVVRHMIGKIYLSEIEVEIGVIPNLLTVSTFPI